MYMAPTIVGRPTQTDVRSSPTFAKVEIADAPRYYKPVRHLRPPALALAGSPLAQGLPLLATIADFPCCTWSCHTGERAIRPRTLTRKNALYAGSNGEAHHWAIAMTLIQSAKMNGIDPVAWLTDVLERVVSGQTNSHSASHPAALERAIPQHQRINKLATSIGHNRQ
jgi:hypothetical protein